MSNLDNNNIQAFPTQHSEVGLNIVQAQPGMSLYDYYVGLAMQGILASNVGNDHIDIALVAERACKVAATVVEVRNKFI